ncbi:MAG TPA: hypothetical protein PKC98_06330 [Candidatus Melainabacteria bacterium]|nr:hypothetical protein [Candidatus Melainabacteria bacterium]
MSDFLAIKDLEPFYPYRDSKDCKAISWQADRFPFVRGPADASFRSCLTEHLRYFFRPLAPAYYQKCHHCEAEDAFGYDVLLVPGQDGILYFVSSLIDHYIECHQYLPPHQFRSALLSCPPQYSEQYFSLLAPFGLLPTERDLYLHRKYLVEKDLDLSDGERKITLASLDLEFGSDEDEVHIILAKGYLLSGRLEEAKARLEMLLSRMGAAFPKNLYKDLFECYLELCEFDAVVSLCDRLIISSQTDELRLSLSHTCHMYRAAACFKTEDPRAALVDLDRAIAIYDLYPEPFYYRALVRRALGDEDGAVRDQERFRELGGVIEKRLF